MSRVIRIDPEVAKRLSELRRPYDKNWSDVIRRVMWIRKAVRAKGSQPGFWL